MSSSCAVSRRLRLSASGKMRSSVGDGALRGRLLAEGKAATYCNAAKTTARNCRYLIVVESRPGYCGAGRSASPNVQWCWCRSGLLFQDVYMDLSISDDVRSCEGRGKPAEVARCDRGM